MEKIFHKSLSVILYSLLFIFPFFFLNFTQEYFVTNKLYLLGFGALTLVLISALQILFSKKISWEKRPFDNLILLFLASLVISIIFASPNKVQAILNPSFGLLMIVSLAILYFYLSGISLSLSKIYYLGSLLLSLITIIFFFQPFKNIALSESFTPVGSQLDLAIFLGFFVVFAIVKLILKKDKASKTIPFLVINLVALFLTVYSLVRPGLILPPMRVSWFAALEILKTPQTALIGIGLDNFSSIFTRAKDFTYNRLPIWQINHFNVSRSAILQIFTEAGILGLATFVVMILSAFHHLLTKESNKTFVWLLAYWLIVALVFPTSLVVWFLFFVLLAEISQQHKSTEMRQSLDLSDLLPAYIGTVIVVLSLVAGGGYLLGRSYASEYYFKKSLDGIAANSAKQVYDNQRRAIIINPYIERYRTSLAQTNLLIANNIAQKDAKEITENDRQTIAQAIQAGISEGKAAISLNPQRADNWQKLALIYQNVINAAQGADVWTISAYQRAIILDPQNPIYRLGLGGVYYSLKNYDDALRFFEQAISLKRDWPNAHYNYAWANFQKGNYSQAVNALQSTLSLLDPKTNKEDYEKVQAEFEEFKKKLTEAEAPTDDLDQQTESDSLNLPTPPTTQISPKLELPPEASPEAN